MHDEGDTNMSQIKGKNLTHVIDDHLNEEMMTTRYDDDNDDDDTSYGPYASFDHSATDGTLLENQFKTTQLIVKEASGKTITRLKKPRDLYALSRQFSAQMTQKWPTEAQIISHRPNHIYFVPSKPEALYKPVQSKDMQSLPRTSQILGKVVYDNSPDLNIKYFTRSKCSGKISPAKQYYRLQGPDDSTLVFESRFESGNLMRAIKIGDYDYELWLRFDLYTSKHTQWYYFMVQNAKPGIQYRFTIMNFVKPGSLYNDGMRPLMYSEYDAENKGIGWTRVGTKIKYYRNDIRFSDGPKDSFYYSLTWSCNFPNDNDTCYFAHCYPYTYSDLQDYLGLLASDPVRSKCCKQRVLCRTLAGNYVYVLTITAPTKRRNEAEIKKAIIITARVHPGETNSSWMMKGFLDFLTSNAADAKLLRENFIFKVIPMLNPDGVIAGNYRCSLAGRDLNRNYKTILKDSFPPIWHTRAMIRKLADEREILMYCDLHGHSRKKNIFIYGCENRQDKQKRFWARVFPAMLAKNAPDKFSLNYCRFKVQKSKEGTGRVYMWNFGIANSFTMEASFCGGSLGNRKDFHFSVADYESIAYQFCDTLLDYYDPDRSKFFKVLSEIIGFIKNVIIERIKASVDDEEDIDIEDRLDMLSEIESDSGGSDSSVSDGLPMQLLHATVPELSRKRRWKTRKERDRRVVKNSNAKDSNSARKVLSRTATSNPTSAKPEQKNGDHHQNGTSKGKMSYTQRVSSASTLSVPHYVKDRFAEKSKLKKDYLDVLTTAFVNSGSGELVNLQDYFVPASNFSESTRKKIFSTVKIKDIPHCRYTAGISSHYQSSKSCLACERCNKCYSDGSDEDSKFPGPKDGQADRNQEIYWQQYGSEQNANTVLDLAKRITVYNHRLNQCVARRSQGTTKLRGENQYEDLSLGPLDDKSVNDGAGWSKQRQRSKELRHFQISQERRISGNGLSSPRRLNSHFEIKRAKSTFNSYLTPRDGLGTSTSDITVLQNDVTSYSNTRRLPQLRKAVSRINDPEVEDRNDKRNHSFSREKDENIVGKSATKNNDAGDKSSQDRSSIQTGKNEISMLKEKMLKCGASGLVNYVLTDSSSQNFVDGMINWPTPQHMLNQRKPDDSYLKENFPHVNNIVGKDSARENHSDNDDDEGRSANERKFSSFVCGFSDLGIGGGKAMKLLQGIEASYENGVRQETNRKEHDDTAKYQKSFTNGNILREGLVTLNVNLNILPLANQTSFEMTSPSAQSSDSTKGTNFPNQESNSGNLQYTWVAEEVPSSAALLGVQPVFLNFDGKEATNTTNSYKLRGNKLNPPQLRMPRKTPKEPSL